VGYIGDVSQGQSDDRGSAALPPLPGRGLLGLRHLALNVVDLERAERYYTLAFGMTVEWRPDPDNVYLTTGGQDNLALHRVTAAARGEGPGPLDHLGIVVGEPGDVDQVAARVTALGHPPDTPIKTHRDGARSFYGRDPEGNRVQVIYHPPISASRR
jgi:catechol 2,3-dioxygenase-like lactoylglutathione lyase family enzyme